MTTLELITNSEGLWCYGRDVISIPPGRNMLDITRALARESYSVTWVVDEKYEARPSDGAHNVAEINFSGVDVGGTIEFIYTSPDGQNQLEEKMKRIIEDVGGKYEGFRKT